MEDLNRLRAETDHIDRLMIETLRDRFLVVSKIGKIKKIKNLSPLNKARWQEVLVSRLAWAEELGVDKDFIKKVLDLIHKRSLEIEALEIEGHEK